MYEKSKIREEYLSRIYKVQDYIEENISEELKLEKLAEVANFSPYHFHRIFKSIVGEPLYQYIKRVSLEKAATLMQSSPTRSIVDIALDCGFSNQASFSRAFKKYFKMTATDWKIYISKNGIAHSKNSKEDIFKCLYNKDEITYKRRDLKMSKVTTDVKIKNLEEENVIYVRNTGPYAGDEALFSGLFEKLCKWAGPRQLINFPETKFITIYHDNPEITEEEKQRISICMTVPKGTKVDGDIGTMKVQGGKYAVGYFELASDEFGSAWEFMCADWLPQSGYQCDDKPSFELSLNDPNEHPEHKHLVEIHIPIKPL